MNISQYTTQTLMEPRGAALEPVAPVTRKRDPSQPFMQETQASQTASDPASLFGTLVDTINPLQHIPGVSTVYREVTGDTANPLASMAGGFLFGGPIGMAAGAAGSFLEMLTGKSLAGHAMALFSGAEETNPANADTIKTAAQLGGGDPLIAPTPGVGLEQYQAFAKAADGIHQGFGANANEVAWAENVWTQQALKQAAGTYETSQHLGRGPSDRTDKIV